MSTALMGLAIGLTAASAFADPPPKPAAEIAAPIIRNVLLHDRHAIIVRNYQLDFYTLPFNVGVDTKLSEGKPSIQFTVGGKPVSLKNLKPTRTLSYKHIVEVSPGFSENLSSVILACTNIQYTPVLLSGKIDQFCGVLSLDGDVVFEFPFHQEMPDKLMRKLRIADDGSWAGVFIGQQIEDEDDSSIGKPREVWVWRAPKTLEKYSARSKKPVVKELLQWFPPGELRGPED